MISELSQATLSEGYYNSNLFSGTYLDNRIQSLEAWDCDTEAEVTFERLRQLWDEEIEIVEEAVGG